MAELKFGITLEDGVSKGARAGALNLRMLSAQFKATKTQLAGYQAQLARANALGDVEGHRKYGALVTDTKRRVFDLAQQVEALPAAGSGLGALSGVFGGIAVAAAAATAAVLALGAGLGSMVKTALDVVDVNRRLTATFEALGAQGPGSGTKTLAFLDKLSTQLPQSRDQLAQWAKQYEALGITDLGELRHQILATASAQAIMGDEGAEAYKKIAERVRVAVEEHRGLKLAEKSLKGLYEAGVNVTEIARKLGMSTQQLAAGLKAGTVDAQGFGNALSTTLVQKGKGPLDAMGDSLTTLEAKASETWRHLFDGIDPAPIVDALKSVIRLGDQGSPSGKNLKDGIQAGVQGVINFLGRMITEAEVFFLRLELYAVQNKPYLLGIAGAFETIAKDIVAATAALGKLISYIPSLKTMQLAISGITGGLIAPTNASAGALAAGAGGQGLGGGGVKALTSPAHADGGIVGRPAPNEIFASVKPGERIVPEGQSGGGVHVDRLEIHITAPNGVTDAHAMSVTGLSLALERLQLAGGR